MSKKEPTIKFGGLYHYPYHLAISDQADFFQNTISMAPYTIFVPIEYAANKAWEKYGSRHRCVKILTESGIIGYVCLRTDMIDVCLPELTEVTS